MQIVEVKGPNDRLSNKQVLWIEFLTGHGVSAVACYVEALGGKLLDKKTSPKKLKSVSPKSPKKVKSPVKKRKVKDEGDAKIEKKAPRRKKSVSHKRNAKLSSKAPTSDDDFA